jgi:hypothetical protein
LLPGQKTPSARPEFTAGSAFQVLVSTTGAKGSVGRPSTSTG